MWTVSCAGHCSTCEIPTDAGLPRSSRASRLLHGAKHEDLTPEKQIELLTMMKQGRAPAGAWKEISSIQFFELLVQQTMQGLLWRSSPRRES